MHIHLFCVNVIVRQVIIYVHPLDAVCTVFLIFVRNLIHLTIIPYTAKHLTGKTFTVTIENECLRKTLW